MQDSSAERIVRRAISVVLVVLTGLIALLWAWPHFGQGGILWTFTLPIGIAYTILVHVLTAPHRAERSVWIPLGIAAGLAPAWFIGLIILAAATPDGSTPAWMQATAMLMMLWPFVMAVGMTVLAVLKLVERSARRSSPATGGATPPAPLPAPVASGGSPYMLSGGTPMEYSAPPPPAFTIGSPSYRSAASPPSAPRPDPVQRPVMPTGPSRPAYPALNTPGPPPLTAPTTTPDSDARDAAGTASGPEPDTAMTVLRAPAAATSVPREDLETLVEVAVGMATDGSDTGMTLTFDGTGVTVSADGMALGTVTAGWSGSDAVAMELSAAELRARLLEMPPDVSLLRIIPRSDGVPGASFAAQDAGSASFVVPGAQSEIPRR